MAALSTRTGLAARVANGRVAAARVKPFTAAVAPKLARFVALKAAEEAAAGEEVVAELAVPADEAAPAAAEEDFSFSLSDARRGNEYSASDVDAALRFYTEGQGSMIYNDEFAKNDFVATVEDSAFFDDLDNNEGWEEDPYAGAGIPEAAPKRKRKDNRAAEEEEEEGDEELKAIEEAKLAVDDELEEVEAARRGEHGPWEWDMEGKEDSAAAPAEEVDEEDDALPSDNAILASVAGANMDAVEESMQELMGFIVEELPLADIDALYEPGPGDAELTINGSVLSGEEAGRIEALLGESVEDAKLSDDILFGNDDGLEVADDGLELDEGLVQDYIKAVRAVAGAEGADAASLEGVASEAAGLEDAVSAAELALVAEALPAGDARLMGETELPRIEIEGERGDVRLYSEMEAEYAKLEAVAVAPWAEAALLDDTEVEILEQYLDNTAEYMAAMASYQEPAAPLFDEARNGVLAGLVNEDLEEPIELVGRGQRDTESFQERVLELSRVTKVVKGGKLMGFRAVVVIGNLHGKVGVGCSSGREVSTAVKRALVDARKNIVAVPITSSGTIPHRVEVKQHSAKVVVVPASEGTGCIAGGAVRSVLELAGVKNCLSKRLGTRNMLNNARATVKALSQLKTLEEVSRARGVPLTMLMK